MRNPKTGRQEERREEKNAAAFGEKIAALGRGPACMPGSMH